MNFSQFLDAAHISTLNCDEMAGERPKQPAYEIFSIQRTVDFSSSSHDLLGLRRPAQAGVKDPLKSGYFTAIISCNVNTVADRHRYAAYHNKHW